MDQPDSIIAEIRAHRLREQKLKLLLADAEKRRLRVAAILSEWAAKTMAEYGAATTAGAAEERDEQGRHAAADIRPQGSHETDRGSTDAPEGKRART